MSQKQLKKSSYHWYDFELSTGYWRLTLHFQLYKGRCSGFIKVLPGYENVFAGHSTYVYNSSHASFCYNPVHSCSWYMYSAMNRVYKHYAINVAASGREVTPATKVMSFSSYPGYLSSLDDFLIMDRYTFHMIHKLRINFKTFRVIVSIS